MDDLLTALRACAEPTRLRLLALAAHGQFCVMDFCEILGQSQPRLSRHLKLLHEAGMLERVREGANVWLALPPPGSDAGGLVRSLVARLPEADAVLAADRRHAARVMAERARAATETFRRTGAEWDEMRALGLPADRVEAALLQALPDGVMRLLDVGTGTGRLLEVLGPRVQDAVGIDASRAMLALARARLGAAQPGLPHCTVRLGDMYRLPLPDGSVDAAVLQMVLHHADDPAAVLAEVARVLQPGGTLLVADLAAHADAEAIARLAHRWPGFDDATMQALLADAGLQPGGVTPIAGPLELRVWEARAPRPPRRVVAAAAELEVVR